MSLKCGAVNKTNCKFDGKYCKKHINYIKTDKYGTNGITFGDQAENHKGMQIIGKSLDKGFTYDDLKQIIKTCDTKGIVTELYNLNIGIKDLPEYKTATDAQVLILRNGVSKILGNSNEHIKLNWDSKAFMYGGVVNKKARHNLCYDNVSQDPDYEAGKGRIIAFDDIPLTKQINGIFW